MTTGSVIFFGRNPSIMALVKNQLSGVGYVAEGILEDEALMVRLAQGSVALLVIGGGIEDGPRLKLRDHCKEHGIRVLEHFGGPDQLVENVARALA
jgi:hypothetical protein